MPFDMEQTAEPKLDRENMENRNNQPRTVSRKRLVRKRSFLDALREKYCVNMNDDNYEFVHIVIGKPRNNGTDAELAHLRNIVLDEHHISHAGIPSTGLADLCPNVVDLDLGSNNIDNWSEILQILTNLPKLKFANISRNHLVKDKEVLQQWSGTLPSIENLVLNSTGISWAEVELMGRHLPALKELHVCGNDFGNLDCNWHKFETLECLRLNNNNIASWSEVWKLRYIRNLKNLILSGNPLFDVDYGPCCQGNQTPGDRDGSPEAECSRIVEDLVQEACQESDKNTVNNTCWQIVDQLFDEACRLASEQDEANTSSSEKGGNSSSTGSGLCPLCKGEPTEAKPFEALQTLCLSKTMIGDWSHLHSLTRFPSLSSVRVTGIPLASDFAQDDRWMLYVASLPKVQLLNGSEITNTEREKSERFFLRHFLSTAESDRPDRFSELEQKHGKLSQLVDIDLGARYEEYPLLNFIIQGRITFSEKIHVVGAVGKLRSFVSEKIGVHRRLFRLYHQSKLRSPIGSLPDLEELFLDALPMSRFDFMTGDDIHVEITSTQQRFKFASSQFKHD